MMENHKTTTPRAGFIGEPREVEFEPLETPAPTVEPAAPSPVTAPEQEPVPA